MRLYFATHTFFDLRAPLVPPGGLCLSCRGLLLVRPPSLLPQVPCLRLTPATVLFCRIWVSLSLIEKILLRSLSGACVESWSVSGACVDFWVLSGASSLSAWSAASLCSLWGSGPVAAAARQTAGVRLPCMRFCSSLERTVHAQNLQVPGDSDCSRAVCGSLH